VKSALLLYPSGTHRFFLYDTFLRLGFPCRRKVLVLRGQTVSVDDVEAGVFAQALGHYDAVGCLVVFEQRCHYARKRESRAVECVAQTSLLVFGAVAAFEAVGLVCLEVR